LPASTRALMLDERLKDCESRCRKLQEQNAQLRHERTMHLARLATVPLTSEVGEISTQTDGWHRQFGRLAADLGHKKVYVASARSFVHTVPIWAQQRACNEGRVDEIVKCKAKAPGLMGPIMCFEYIGFDGEPMETASVMCPQPRAIFDGQHRARAAMRLLESDAFSITDDDDATGGTISDFEMLVEVYSVTHESQIKALYLECNKAEAVKEIDLPDTLAPDMKAYIDGAVEAWTKKFPEMFKPSERCRPPHLHRDTLRNKLFQTPATHSVGGMDELVAMMTRANDRTEGARDLFVARAREG